jgi:hypothetical protein
MTKAPDSDRARRSRPPGWLFEGLDLIDQRRRALLITVGMLVLIALVVAFFAPGILPPTPLVGAAVGVAALLLAIVVLIALDSADLTVRGPRHVRAAGGELVAVLPSRADAAGATELAAAIQDVRPAGRTLLLGVAAATGDGRRSAAWVDRLGHRLAQEGASVLTLDLTGEGNGQPGFLEIIREGAKLTSVVDLDPDMRLARLGAGRNTNEALRAFVEAGSWIPRDLEVLLVALPMAASRPVVRASLVLDQLLLVAERDRTSRVELIAGLDAVEAVGTQAQVILIDDAFARHLGVGGAPSGPREQPVDPADAAPLEDPVPPEDASAPAVDPSTQVIEDEATVAMSRSDPHRATVPEPQPMPQPDPMPDPAPTPMPDPLPDPMPDPAPQPEPTPMPDPLPDPMPQPDPMPEPEPTPDPMPQPTPMPDPEPMPEPTSQPEPQPGRPDPMPEPTSQPEPQAGRIEHETTDPLHRDAPDGARDPATTSSQPDLMQDPTHNPTHNPGPTDGPRRDSADDTDSLPRFVPTGDGPTDDQEMLTSTARLSRLMDEVADRESDRSD